MRLPKCSSYKSWTDCGYEHDCDAIHERTCDECLCTYKSLGGLWHPKTGKRTLSLVALFLYGAKNTEHPTSEEEQDNE